MRVRLAQRLARLLGGNALTTCMLAMDLTKAKMCKFGRTCAAERAVCLAADYLFKAARGQKENQ